MEAAMGGQASRVLRLKQEKEKIREGMDELQQQHDFVTMDLEGEGYQFATDGPSPDENHANR